MQWMAAATFLVAAGCAEDRPTIDTVQPNRTKKSDVLGREWYLRMTVVDAAYTSGLTFPGATSKLVRGVFDVQEGALFFYRTYEFAVGSSAYAMKSDADTPVLGPNGKPVQHAAPQDYQKIHCSADQDCRSGAWCAGVHAPRLPDEEDWNGFCVQQATLYVYRGAPILAYPISSHFDIRAGYSAATGEKTNKIEENTTDRKWYDREYMRVSWGAQQILTYEGDIMGEILMLAGPTPKGGKNPGYPEVYEGDNAPEGEKFATGIDRNLDPAGQHWFSYINRVIATAKTANIPGLGEVPACYFPTWYSGGVFDCASDEIKIRTFFLEVPKFEGDPQRRYVAREQDDVEFQKFGYFRTERQVYDIEYGSTFHNAVRRAQRHRTWDRYVKKYEAMGSKTVWNGDFDYEKMNPVPIVYYLNEDHPRELVPAALAIAKAWSEPLVDVVAFHKGKKPDFPMFILCENSNQAGVDAQDAGQITAEFSGVSKKTGKNISTAYHKFCRDMNKPHQFGDLRYSVLHAVVAPNQARLYGYGPSSADPITGEIIAASAHAYVAPMKAGAERAMQTLELLAGIKDANDIARGSEAKFNMKAKVLRRYDAKAPNTTTQVRGAVAGMLDGDVRQHLATAGIALEADGATYAQARMAKLRQNPMLDAMLANDDEGHSIQALFKDPTLKPGVQSNLSDEQLAQMSLATWAHTAGFAAREKIYRILGEKTLHFESFADAALLGLAIQYGKRFDEGLCRAYANATTPTLFHGFTDTVTVPADNCTTVGQFESLGTAAGRVCVTAGGQTRWAPCSSRQLMQELRRALDAADGNYPNAEAHHGLPGPLWSDTMDPVLRETQRIGLDVTTALRNDIKADLWQRIYQGTQQHEVGHTLGLRHNFEGSTDALNYHKEYWDLKLDKNGEVINPWQPDTQEQAKGNIRTQALASVMDYCASWNGQFAGVGNYDRAAIKFGYGDIVEVFDHAPDLTTSPGGDLAPMADYLLTPGQDDPSVKPLQDHGATDLLKLTRRLHYSTLPKYFGSVDNMYARSNKSWHALKGRACNSDDQCGGGNKCRALGDASYCADTSVTEVPYRFCSDELNGMTPTCATFDEGADAYEIARNQLDYYENYWFFYGYARDSETYSADTYSATVQNCFETAARQFQFWAVDFATFQKDGWWAKHHFDHNGKGLEYDEDVNGGLSGAYATLNTFNTLTNVIARPTTGYFMYNAGRKRFEPYNSIDNISAAAHWLDTMNGARPLYPDYGGGYLYRPMSGGQIYDRIAAFRVLSDPTTNFVANSEAEDTRRYLVSFFNAFPRQLINLFGAVSVEDGNSYGWYVLQGATDSEDYVQQRAWAGPAASDPPKLCTSYDKDTAAKDKIGCLKYVIFPDGRPTFPSSRFRMPLLGSLYGMSLLTKGFNRSYMDVSRVFIKGNQAGIELPADVTTASFTDPLSGKTYVAPMIANDTANPGYEAVLLAAAELAKFKDLSMLQQGYLFSEYQFRVSLLDLLRTMHETYEY